MSISRIREEMNDGPAVACCKQLKRSPVPYCQEMSKRGLVDGRLTIRGKPHLDAKREALCSVSKRPELALQ
jgi:hypothetical protein